MSTTTQFCTKWLFKKKKTMDLHQLWRLLKKRKNIAMIMESRLPFCKTLNQLHIVAARTRRLDTKNKYLICFIFIISC